MHSVHGLSLSSWLRARGSWTCIRVRIPLLPTLSQHTQAAGSIQQVQRPGAALPTPPHPQGTSQMLIHSAAPPWEAVAPFLSCLRNNPRWTPSIPVWQSPCSVCGSRLACWPSVSVLASPTGLTAGSAGVGPRTGLGALMASVSSHLECGIPGLGGRGPGRPCLSPQRLLMASPAPLSAGCREQSGTLAKGLEEGGAVPLSVVAQRHPARGTCGH